MDKVSIVRANGIMQSLQKAISYIGGIHNPRSSPFLIKPNICIDIDASGGANTDIRLIRSIMDMILEKEQKSTVRIIESDSAAKYIDEAFENFGYYNLEDEYKAHGFDVSLINLSKEPAETIALNGLYFENIKLPKILLEPKFLISAAKAKTHGLTYITGTLKNQFGCLPEKDKSKHHRHITEAIIDLNLAIKPDLCVVDGIVGMEGVETGRLRNLGLILCGYQPVSVDAILARVMGFDPLKIRQITLGKEKGLGSINPLIVGEKIENVITPFQPPNTTIAHLGEYVPQSLRPFARKIYRRLIGHNE